MQQRDSVHHPSKETSLYQVIAAVPSYRRHGTRSVYFACCSAKFPIKGILKRSPLLAFTIATSQRIRNPKPTGTIRSHPMIGMIPRIRLSAIAAAPKKMDCQEWKRTNELRLYGSIAKKMIAGIMVRYAIAPAAVSDKPPCWTGIAAGAPVVVFAPQCGQKVELLPVSVLQDGQSMACAPWQRNLRRLRP